MFLSDVLGGSIPIATGDVAITVGDFVEMAGNGLAYSAKSTNGVQKTNIGQSIIAQTAAGSATGLAQISRPGFLRIAATACQFQVVPNGTGGTGGGVTIEKYFADGSVLATLPLDISANTMRQSFLGLLPTGNIVCLYTVGSGAAINYAIFDQNLNPVKAVTAIEAVNANARFGACVMSGGGFAVLYQQQASASLQRLATYDNTGTATSGPATVMTWTGTTGVVSSAIGQLSDGNLALACLSYYTTTKGTYSAVYSVTGTVVHAFANVSSATPGPSAAPLMELAILPGFFAICNVTAANLIASVLTNANAQSGGNFTATTTIGNNPVLGKTKLVADALLGVFWMLWDDTNAVSSKKITMIPTTGTGFLTYATGIGTSYSRSCDAYEEHGYIVVTLGATATGDTSPQVQAFALIVTLTSVLIATIAQNLGSGSPTQTAQYVTGVTGGDFTVCAAYDYEGIGMCVAQMKIVNTGSQGVAVGSAGPGPGTFVSVAILGPGGKTAGFGINFLPGSASLVLGTGGNVLGNSGTIMNNAVVLKGF